ncbi:hypothetical protein [Streptomyces sp. NPDC020681]|uniref:hypothetical protein n=1 Tax=Streptomyces sp. NPDC020681 TaxID=3365083 RepID=UPI003789D75D
MTRMTKYVAAAAAVAALVGAPTIAHATGSSGSASGSFVAPTGARAAAAAPKASHPSPTGVQVVAPGQRVPAAPGVELWLTKQGKHWSTPEQPDQFRSVVDGNLDMSKPGVSLQAEPVDDFYFLSGVWYGSRKAARVVVETEKGKVTAEMVTLKGRPGWGAWYASSPLPDSGSQSFLRSVTLFDAKGRQLAKHELN